MKSAENNRLRKIPLLAPRGRIVGLSGEVLADDLIIYQDAQGKELEREQALLQKAAGGEVVDVLARRYLLKEAAAHLTGYLGSVGEKELGKKRCAEKDINYSLHDQVGRGGLEEIYDCLLAGEEGEKLVEVDSQGQIVRELGRIDPQPGEDLVVSLDLGLQKFAWEKIKDLKAAVVVLEAETGKILALVSAPSFDPNVFGLDRDEEKVKSYLGDRENTPLFNRALAGAYQPGSVFKPVLAVAGLEERVIDSQTSVFDTGFIQIGEWQYKNWYWTDYGRTEGEVNLVKAIQRSNDIYFYKLGEWLGVDNISKWASRLGLGKKTGIDLPAEASGLVPTADWKRQVRSEIWFLGNTYHFAIGQGDLTTTPLQIAQMTAAVTNGGRLCQPQINGLLESNCLDLGISRANLEVIKEGMRQACQSGGTGFPFFDFNPPAGCKTGTAQTGGEEESHAWLSAFFPADKPKISMVVFVEKGGSGAYVAAPIAREIADYLKNANYF
ncbi:MAG: penicillin-binding transpeptidase domain-containing protein [Candidatus Shapirobacteria bacterium]